LKATPKGPGVRASSDLTSTNPDVFKVYTVDSNGEYKL